MPVRSVVFYLSKTGSVEEVAMKLAKTLDGYNDVENIKRNLDHVNLAPFHRVVFGCSIRFNKLNKKFLKTVNKYKKQLKGKKVVCYLLGVDKSNITKHIDEIKNIFDQEVDVFYLGGEIHLSRMNYISRVICKEFIKNKSDDEISLSLNEEEFNKMLLDLNNIDKSTCK